MKYYYGIIGKQTHTETIYTNRPVEDEVKSLANDDPQIKKFIDGKTIRKVIYVPKKLLNIVANLYENRSFLNLKNNGIDETAFQRIKKMLYGRTVKEFTDVSDICRMFLNDYFKGINSFNYLENYKQISSSYTMQILEEVFKEEKTVISIIN